METREKLCNFCVAIQTNSPVDAHVEPVPAMIPGYQDEIIMAAGTFVQGASIELSADGPCREPYNVYFQGGLTFEHGRIAIMSAARMVGPQRIKLYRQGGKVNERKRRIYANYQRCI